jgi:hypothetical protein
MTGPAKLHDTEGPLGIPMKDAQARLLEAILKTLPEEDRRVKRLVTAKSPAELLDGERADVSWISTEEIDREKEIVWARGMNDSQFRMNPIVTLQHSYHMPPIGRSVWRKRTRDGALKGIKAKTQYPPRPADWPDDYWGPDEVFALVKGGLMNGKSIGFIRLKSHAPNSHEIAARPELGGVSRIIDEWLLLEYACVFLPCNQNALVEQVSKGLPLPPGMEEVLGFDARKMLPAPETPAAEALTTNGLIHVPFTSEEQVNQLIRRRLEGINPQSIVQDAIERAKGRI